MPSSLLPAVTPIARRVRAFFAPVSRASGQPTLWDPAGIAAFDPSAPPAPWIDLGWVSGFVRKSVTHSDTLMAGAPGVPLTQVRTEIGALLQFTFESWGKLPLALSAGVQQMNVLSPAVTSPPANPTTPSGGATLPAVPLNTGSTADTLDVGAAVTSFHLGDVVAVDIDYTGQTGFVGALVSGGYVKSPAAISNDIDYIRRVTLNVGRVSGISGHVLTLGTPLLAGTPAAGMKVSRVVGFCDREGGGFFQEWSGLFVLDGEQGDRVVFHYPRLQALSGAEETYRDLSPQTAKNSTPGRLQQLRLAGNFRALPVRDGSDGEMIVCFRTYLPAAMRTV